MKSLIAVSRGIDAVTTAIGRAMFWLTLVMVLIGAVNVVTRYIGRAFNLSLGGTRYIALQTYAYNLVFLLGAAHVFNRDGHVRVDIFYAARSPRTKAWIDILGTVFFLFPFCILGFYLSWGYVVRSWQQGEINVNAGGLPVYPIKTAILIAFALLMLQGVSEIIKRVALLRGHAPPPTAAPADIPHSGARGADQPTELYPQTEMDRETGQKTDRAAPETRREPPERPAQRLEVR